MCHQTKFSCKMISSSDIFKSHVLMILSLAVTLTLETANQPFRKTTWLIMMHHHTKFGSKRFRDSEDTIWTDIHWHFEILLCSWPWTQQFQFLHKTLWLMIMFYQTKFGSKRISSLKHQIPAPMWHCIQFEKALIITCVWSSLQPLFWKQWKDGKERIFLHSRGLKFTKNLSIWAQHTSPCEYSFGYSMYRVFLMTVGL